MKFAILKLIFVIILTIRRVIGSCGDPTTIPASTCSPAVCSELRCEVGYRVKQDPTGCTCATCECIRVPCPARRYSCPPGYTWSDNPNNCVCPGCVCAERINCPLIPAQCPAGTVYYDNPYTCTCPRCVCPQDDEYPNIEEPPSCDCPTCICVGAQCSENGTLTSTTTEIHDSS